MKIKISKKDWSIDAVYRRKGRINPKPQYQRTPVWNETKKQLLIDSVLRGYDLPKFYLRSSDPPYDHEVVDGQQRLYAIWDFRDDQYALGDKSKTIPDFGDLSGKRWSELSSLQQDQIADFPLSVVVIEAASESEIRQLFRRLQEGVTLNPAEKRNAIEGKIRDFVADLGENHKVFLATRLSEDRYNWHNLAAIVTCLEIAKGPTDVKAPSLETMYEKYSDFDDNGSIARKVKRNLNYMAKVLKNRPREMDIKWGFVDLYLLISKMDDLNVIRQREKDFTNFYRTFEKDRRKAISKPSNLLSHDSSDRDKALYQYIEAFIRAGGTKENLEKRHEVYKKLFIKDIQDLASKDPQRAFTPDQRILIWHRANEKCQRCKKEIDIDEMEADHIIPHGKGGQTTIDNGRALCKQCHVKKGTT